MDNDGFSPAHLAANNGCKAILTALMEAGADLDTQKESIEKRTVLELILMNRTLSFLPALISFIEVTTQDIEKIRRSAVFVIQLHPDDKDRSRRLQYIDAGLEFRAQYPARLAQQLVLLQEVIPVPQLTQLVHRLVGRQIFSLEHVKALTAAQTT